MNFLSPSARKVHAVPLTPISGAWQNRLKQQFPQEEEAIDRFFFLVNKIPHLQSTFSLLGIVKLRKMPLWLIRWWDKLGLFRLSHFFSLNRQTLSQVTRVSLLFYLIILMILK